MAGGFPIWKGRISYCDSPLPHCMPTGLHTPSAGCYRAVGDDEGLGLEVELARHFHVGPVNHIPVRGWQP